MSNPVLIGTGFYADAKNHAERREFLVKYWLPQLKDELTCIVDNSVLGLDLLRRSVRIYRNLGHMADSPYRDSHKLLGWSMSWIIPALVAYSDGCDFVYKEQDCLTFGNWLPEIQKGRFAFGRNSVVPCEQSLFWIRHDAILEVVQKYIALDGNDSVQIPEWKFARLLSEVEESNFFDMPCGRERPLTLANDKPWYAQKLQAHEMQQLKNWGFI